MVCIAGAEAQADLATLYKQHGMLNGTAQHLVVG
jgi:hypothetical protein